MEIDKYNSLEKINKKKLPNLIIECFASHAFDKIGYPTRVEEFQELKKFIDVMQENRYFDNLKRLKYLSKEEYNLLKKISSDINDFARTFDISNFG